jgi:hypothetical protein
MGLLKHLLFWPVTGPEFLARFSITKVNDAVREELTDDQAVKEELLALQMQLELGEVDDDEYVEREAELMQRLRDVRQWREEFGMGSSGGPVRVSREQALEESTDEVPDLAENVVSAPEGDDERIEEAPPSGGIANPGGASVEINLDWDWE